MEGRLPSPRPRFLPAATGDGISVEKTREKVPSDTFKHTDEEFLRASLELVSVAVWRPMSGGGGCGVLDASQA